MPPSPPQLGPCGSFIHEFTRPQPCGERYFTGSSICSTPSRKHRCSSAHTAAKQPSVVAMASAPVMRWRSAPSSSPIFMPSSWCGAGTPVYARLKPKNRPHADISRGFMWLVPTMVRRMWSGPAKWKPWVGAPASARILLMAVLMTR